MSSERLTRKQETFVEAFVETGVGSEAAKAAYNIDATDPKRFDLTARVIASENLTKPNIIQAIHDALPDDVLGKKHRELLDSTRLEHMTFPLGPKSEIQREELNASHALDAQQHGKRLKVEDGLSDEEIRSMLAEVNCKVRRIEHGEHARHVYFWAADNRAVKDALDMAYKIKGTYAPDKHAHVHRHEPSDRIKDLARKLNTGVKHTFDE